MLLKMLLLLTLSCVEKKKGPFGLYRELQTLHRKIKIHRCVKVNDRNDVEAYSLMAKCKSLSKEATQGLNLLLKSENKKDFLRGDFSEFIEMFKGAPYYIFGVPKKCYPKSMRRYVGKEDMVLVDRLNELDCVENQTLIYAVGNLDDDERVDVWSLNLDTSELKQVKTDF